MNESYLIFAEAKTAAQGLADRDDIEWGAWRTDGFFGDKRYYLINEHDNGWTLLDLVFVAKPGYVSMYLSPKDAHYVNHLLNQRVDKHATV